jgi:hypothetical protein
MLCDQNKQKNKFFFTQEMNNLYSLSNPSITKLDKHILILIKMNYIYNVSIVLKL